MTRVLLNLDPGELERAFPGPPGEIASTRTLVSKNLLTKFALTYQVLIWMGNGWKSVLTVKKVFTKLTRSTNKDWRGMLLLLMCLIC